MVLKLKFTEKIRNFSKHLLFYENILQVETAAELLVLLNSKDKAVQVITWKSLQDLILCFEATNPLKSEPLNLSDLLEGSDIVLKPIAKKVNKDREQLESVLARIRTENEEKEYQRMVKDVVSISDNSAVKEIVSEWKEVNSFVLTIFNVLFSVLASGYMVFYLLGLYTGLGSIEIRIFAGLLGGFVVAFAEGFLAYRSVTRGERKKVEGKVGEIFKEKIE